MKYVMLLGISLVLVSCSREYGEPLAPIETPCAYGCVEELELDPQSQFNLARRRMRKDILDLEAMDIFNGTRVFYDEVVMAAFETGYLSIEVIEFAVRYDDLWNPTQTRFERISGFIFSFTGYATFFVPPPYNVTASLGLAIIQGIVNSSNVKGEDNDNAATFIQ